MRRGHEHETMTAIRILETVLYAGDLDAAERFYTQVIGLAVASRFEDAVAFTAEESVLLVFDPGRSISSDRSVPPHGTHGAGHIAFATDAAELPEWRRRLKRHGIEIESETEWGSGRRSLYFRDPAGNLIELAPPDLWNRST